MYFGHILVFKYYLELKKRPNFHFLVIHEARFAANSPFLTKGSFLPNYIFCLFASFDKLRYLLHI